MSNEYPSNNLLPFDLALNMMLDQADAVTEQERLPITMACDRILAHSVTSPIDLPSFNNSAMDGYAVRLADLSLKKALPIAGSSLAGHPFNNGPLPAGHCVRIMTGAAVPAEADTIIIQEFSEVLDEGVIFHDPELVIGQNIRYRGEELKAGEIILNAGTKLTLAHLPQLVALGISQLQVFRRLNVALFSTGDELIGVGESLQSGQRYDTNRFIIKLMLEKLGMNVIDLGIIADDEKALRQVFHEAEQQADIIISSGGVSVGDADFTKSVLDSVGSIHFWRIAMKPGKPFAFGRLKQAWFCGLPGNPVSATLVFYKLIQPFLIKLSGVTHWKGPTQFKAKTLTPLDKKPGRADFQRGVLFVNEQNEWVVKSSGNQGSHLLGTFAHANCFILLECERNNVAPGEWVTVEPFNSLLENELC